MCARHCDKAFRATAYLSLQTTLLGRDGYFTEGDSEIPAQSHPANKELRFKHFSFHLHNDHMLTREGEKDGQGGGLESWGYPGIELFGSVAMAGEGPIFSEPLSSSIQGADNTYPTGHL